MTPYVDVLNAILSQGASCNDRTGVGTFSLPGAQMQFDMREGFPLLTLRPIPYKSVFAELVGFLRGYTNAAEFRSLGTKIWDANANDPKWQASPFCQGPDDMGRVYGSQWVSWRVYQPLKPEPNLRAGVPRTYLGVGNGAGKDNHPLKKTWEGMMARCYDQNSRSYPLYGAKGVYVCNRWLEFSAFAQDAEKLPGWALKQADMKSFAYQLDKDIRGNGYCYSLETCSWVTSQQNSDAKKSPTITVERSGKHYTFTNVSEFCAEHEVEAKNFSDLWTGKKNAKSRGGFSLVRIVQPPAHAYEINQLQECLDQLRNNPSSRRILFHAWNPAELHEMCLPPCHLLYQFHVHGERISLSVYIRSNDMGLGAPFNIASAAALLQVFADASGLTPWKLTISIGDAHVYMNHFEAVKEMMDRHKYESAPELPRMHIEWGTDPQYLNMDQIAATLKPESFVVRDYFPMSPVAAMKMAV